MTEMKLTENEHKIIYEARNVYQNYDKNEFCYETDVYNYSELDPKVARGVLSSLVKKGILKHWKDEGQNYYRFK